MLLCELLRPALIKPGLKAETRKESIGELVDLLVQQHEIPMSKRHRIFELLMAREEVHGTGMEKGIAIPHIATDEVDDILCALGTAPHGIPFECLDGLHAKLIILFLLPKRNYTGRVRTLAAVANLLEHATLKDQIVVGQDAQAIYDLIEREERAETAE